VNPESLSEALGDPRRLRRLLDRVSDRLGDRLSVSLSSRLQRSGLLERMAAFDAQDNGSAAPPDPAGRDAAGSGQSAEARICSQPDCELPARARGLCSKHYQRLRYAQKRAEERGDPVPEDLEQARSQQARKPNRRTAKRGGGVCSVEGCERTNYAKGMCGKHFMEWVRSQKNGD
jgi:hypothetical protein